MAIKFSDLKRVQWKETLILNYLLFFYPTVIFLTFFFTKTVKDSEPLISLLTLYFLFILFIPLLFTLVIGPFYSLVAEGISFLRIPILQPMLLLMVFPISLVCSTMIFVGTPINFGLALLSERFRFEKDPELFRWNTYIFLLYPVEGIDNRVKK